MLSEEIIRELREDHAEADRNLFSGRCTSDMFSMLHVITLLLTICISYTFYICYTIQPSTRCPRERERERERESGSKHAAVFTLARLKIVPSYHQELVSHPMPEHIEAS